MNTVAFDFGDNYTEIRNLIEKEYILWFHFGTIGLTDGIYVCILNDYSEMAEAKEILDKLQVPKNKVLMITRLEMAKFNPSNN